MKNRKEEIEKLRETLCRDRSAILAVLSNESMSVHTVMTEDTAAQQTEQMEVEGEITAVETKRLGNINEALEKIKSGTYGTCDNCGADIALARLQALPYAVRCLKCQSDMEIAS